MTDVRFRVDGWAADIQTYFAGFDGGEGVAGARGVGVYVVPFVEPVASGSVTTQFDNFVVAGPVVGFDAP